MNGHWLCFFAFFHVTKPSWNPPEQLTASGVINHLVIIFVSDNFTCLHFGQVVWYCLIGCLVLKWLIRVQFLVRSNPTLLNIVIISSFPVLLLALKKAVLKPPHVWYTGRALGRWQLTQKITKVPLLFPCIDKLVKKM